MNASKFRWAALGLLLLLLIPVPAVSEPELLPPDKAFAFDAYMEDYSTLVAEWRIADGYYLYGDKFELESLTDGIELGEIEAPAGKTHEDPFFGIVETHRGLIQLRADVIRAPDAPDSFSLRVRSQGCADIGICYPPHVQNADVPLNVFRSGSSAVTATASVFPIASSVAFTPAAPLSEQDRLAALLADGQAWLVLLAFFGLGLLLAFTPCVLPMIPILSNIILGQKQITTAKAFTISLVFVLAMALTYTLAGVLAGLAGASLQAMFQNPWIIGSFVAVFVALALSMFGFYELQMPSAVQSRLSMVSGRQQAGTLAGAGIMGVLSALIVGPCVTAPLVGALLYISQTGDALLGGLALFSLSMGMGLPLLVLGTSAGRFLPRVGPWMESTRAIFGVLLLAMGIWLLERVAPAPLTLLLWSLLCMVSAIYLGALSMLPPDASGWRKLFKGLGLGLLVWGILLMIGVASGGRDVLRPLEGLTSSATIQQQARLDFRPVSNVAGLEQALELAAAANQPVMLDFYADWCVDCVRMERTTFQDTGVIAALSGVRLIKADVTDNTEEHRELLRKFELYGPPAILFFDRQGREIRASRQVGYMAPEAFRAHVQQALGP